MALRITEFGGFASGRPQTVGIPNGGPIQTQLITIGSSVSTNALSSATRLVLLDTDAGCLVFIGSSISTQVPTAGSSGTPVTSTAGASIHLFPNLLPYPVYVSPYSRICSLST